MNLTLLYKSDSYLAYVSLEKFLCLRVKLVGEWLRVGDTKRVNIGEPVIPGLSGHIAKSDHPLDRLLELPPGAGEVHALRLQRHPCHSLLSL